LKLHYILFNHKWIFKLLNIILNSHYLNPHPNKEEKLYFEGFSFILSIQKKEKKKIIRCMDEGEKGKMKQNHFDCYACLISFIPFWLWMLLPPILLPLKQQHQHQHLLLSLSSSFPMLKLPGFIATDPIEFPHKNWRKNRQVRIFWRHGSCEKEERKWVRTERTMTTTTCSRWCWSEIPALGNRTSCLDSPRTNSAWNLNPPLALNSPPAASTSMTRS